jgi:hypothetical protein
MAPAPAARRLFLLSPARSDGQRMAMLLSPHAGFALARTLQGEGAALGDVFRFASGLYFRGKLAYAVAFGRPAGGAAALVMAPGAGLVPATTVVRPDDLRAYAEVPVDPDEPRFRAPLVRDAAMLAAGLAEGDEVVLLGSIAAAKYVEPLLEVLGARLRFPASFVGRGDMSRGGLLLRAVQAGVELEYVPAAGAVRRGSRPPRLTPAQRR